jgi:DNA-directed RNA polymerase subunit M/transcription elongation factor TFIIS
MNELKRKKNVKKILEFVNYEKAILIECSAYSFSKIYAENNNIEYLIESIYDSKIEDIIINLSNLLIIKLINENKIDIKNIAFLNLNVDTIESVINKQKLTEEIKKGSTLYKCEKCGKSNSEITQKQTRSGDEPPTTYVKCLECGNSIILE